MAAGIKSDQDLAKEVRRMTLRKIKKIYEDNEAGLLDEDDKKLHDRLLEKLAGTVMPRITEVSGPDGEPIQTEVLNIGERIKLDQLLNGKIPDQTTE